MPPLPFWQALNATALIKLLELIPYLRDPSTLAAFYRRQGMNPDEEEYSIYMEGHKRLESNVRVFAPEETGDESRFEHEGHTYVELLPVFLAVDLLAEDPALQGPLVTDTTRAERLVHYSVYDA